MKRVRVGVTSPLVSGEPVPPDIGAVQHCSSLERLGAEAILLRNDMPVRGLIEDFGLAALVFSGGGDIAPSSYGGNEALSGNDVDCRRDSFEFSLLEAAFQARLPVLATCRGMEVANVLRGGTLIEDLHHHLGDDYTTVHHQVDEAGLGFGEYAHDVTIVAESLLYSIVQTQTLRVNSIHHQAIDHLGEGLRAVAHSRDGIIEAIEFIENSPFFIGVQWHPEWLPDDPVSKRLYTRLLAEIS